MLKFINRKIAFQWVLFLGLLTFAIYTIITKTQITSQQGSAFLFNIFTNFFSRHQLFGKVIIIIILLSQIILIQFYFIKNEYTTRNSFLPACFYLSILLITKSLVVISPFFFTLLFFIAIISTNYMGNAVTLKNNALWVGMLIAIATCFDLSSVVLLVLAIITLIINHFSKIKEICILMFGFLLVYFYFFSFYFFINNHNEWILTFQQIKILGILDGETLTRSSTQVALITLTLIYFYFIIRTKIINDSKVVVQRKKIITLNARAMLMIVCLFISNSTYPNVLGYLFIHISIYLALLAQEKSPLYINELITIATLLVLWL